jgi:site-specific DNA-methyltransferase (adenine-specific)
MNEFLLGDCIEVMKQIPPNSVDLVICDPPYGQTHNRWDCLIPFPQMWKSFDRVCKVNAPRILFAQGMFSAEAMISNRSQWRYNLIWEKDRPSGFLNANRMPMRSHEDILVFYKKKPIYNPQKWLGKPEHSIGQREGQTQRQYNYGHHIGVDNAGRKSKHPRSVLHFKRPHPPIHPTQKPVDLYQWLIETYTNEGAVVLDPCSGSGTCAVACQQCNRNYLCIDISEEFIEKGRERAGQSVAKAGQAKCRSIPIPELSEIEASDPQPESPPMRED